MKILVVVPDMLLGGVTSSAINFCKECRKRGNEVDILVMDGAVSNIPDVNQIVLKGPASLWNLSAKQLKNKRLFAKISFAAVASIKKITNHFELWLPIVFHRYKVHGDYDVALAFRQCAPCYYFTLKCTKARTKIGMIHGNLNFMGNTGSWDKYFPLFNKIACVSDAVAKDFKEKFRIVANKFITIYNMFDVEDIHNKASQPCLFNVDRSLTNIITVSRHENNHKRVNRVVEVCAELRKRGVNRFHWYIAGDGPDFDYNQKLAKDMGVDDLITFCGSLDNPYALQHQCDFSVITSATEAYSMSVIESQILKKPIVAMYYPGIEEAIIDGETGLICSQDTNSLCDAILRLIEKTEFRQDIVKSLNNRPYTNDKPYNQLLHAVNS